MSFGFAKYRHLQHVASAQVYKRLLNGLTQAEKNYINAQTNPFYQSTGSQALIPARILDSDNSVTIPFVLTSTYEITANAAGSAQLIKVVPPTTGGNTGIWINTSAMAGTPGSEAATATVKGVWSGWTAYNAICSSNPSRIVACGLNIFPTSAPNSTSGSIICGNMKLALGTGDGSGFTATATILNVLHAESPSSIDQGITLRTPPEQYNNQFHAPVANFYDATMNANQYLPCAFVTESSTTSVMIRAVIYMEVQISQTSIPFPVSPSPTSMYWNEILAIVGSNEFPILASGHSFKSFGTWVKSKIINGMTWVKNNPSKAVTALGRIAGFVMAPSLEGGVGVAKMLYGMARGKKGAGSSYNSLGKVRWLK